MTGLGSRSNIRVAHRSAPGVGTEVAGQLLGAGPGGHGLRGRIASGEAVRIHRVEREQVDMDEVASQSIEIAATAR